jgi:N-methylhydantoinase B
MYDPIQLELFKHRFAAIADEMGVVLRRAAYSPNIKERLDFSCAVFNPDGQMIAQAAHIPVHLGAMPISVKTAIEQIEMAPGDVVLLNDPFQGGSHLPDITMIAPVFLVESLGNRDVKEKDSPTPLPPTPLLGYVASRAHHADVGGMTPGSMPLSQEIYQEGVIIPPLKLIAAGRVNEAVMSLLLANVRTPEERRGDLQAQMAANQRGVARLVELVSQHGLEAVTHYMEGLLEYAERMTRHLLSELPDGHYTFSDFMDSAGVDPEPVEIKVAISIEGDEAVVDFTGSAAQVKGSVNAVYAVTLAAVHYVFRALIGLDIPSNSGCLAPIRVIAPPGTVVNARPPAAVAAGNVETSQRITDVLLGALALACPERVPAASQGTMNNFVIGGWDPARNRHYTYYETIGGGMGAGPNGHGADAIHSHMTNTLNTPIEALEYAYPFLMHRYEIRSGSGGAGRHRGGHGVVREMELLHEAQATIVSERRRFAPYGAAGGQPGQVGRNLLIRQEQETELAGKTTITVQMGDRLLLKTPGGGGYGVE